MNRITKLLFVEDGSIDIEELQQILPDNIKIVVYLKGTKKPELQNLCTLYEEFCYEKEKNNV